MAEPQSSDRGALRLAICAALVMAQLVAAKAARDALFLTHFEARYLPAVMVATSVWALLIALGVGRAMTIYSPEIVAPRLLLLNAVLFAVELLGLEDWPATVAVATYLHTGGLGAVVVSAFWSLINETFDPHAARRLIGRIVTGAAVGGICGGLLILGLSQLMTLRGLLAILALLNVLAIVGLRRIRTEAKRPAAALEPPRGIPVILETPYLGQLAALVATLAAADAVVDYAFKARVREQLERPEDLVFFFAAFQSAVAFLTFALQSVLAGRLLKAIGISKTIALLPGTVLIGAITALFVPVVATASILRAASAAVTNSLFRSGYELLYTPLSLAKKRSAKALIDVAIDKGGSVAGSAAIIALGSIFAEESGAMEMILALSLSLIALGLTRRLHRGYVGALAENLKSGAIHLDVADALDATTRRTLRETIGLDQIDLKHELAKARAAATPSEVEASDRLLADVADLRASAPERVKSALLRIGQPSAQLVGHVIPLLAKDEVLTAVRASLLSAAPYASGQLVDALLDRNTDERIRRRLPRVLQIAGSPRVVAGLLAALDDPSFEVRFRTGTALLELRTTKPELRFAAEPVMAAVRAELTRSEARLADQSDAPLPFDAADATPRNRRLSHVFTLLALVYDAEPLNLAFRALSSADTHMRGTGREFLEVTLPADLIVALSPLWTDAPVEAASR